MSDAVVERVTRMVTSLVTDLKLDLYDVEYRGGVLRITVDTPPGSPGGVDLDTISLLTRMSGRDFDHDDPMPGHYTLEVTSPGLERTLRTPAHYRREIGKTVNVRLRDVAAGDRRVQGTLVAADDTSCVVRLDDAPKGAELTERTIPYSQIDRAKTVFVWAAAPKPGKGPGKQAGKSAGKQAGSSATKRTAASRAAATGSSSAPDATGSTTTTADPAYVDASAQETHTQEAS